MIWSAVFLLALTIVGDVRRAINKGDLAGAESVAAEYKKTQGVTPEYLEAYSWLARGALTSKRYDQAERYAAETKRQSIALLKARKLDDEPHLPIALGAAIEVQGQVYAARGDRARALEYMNDELEAYRATSIRTRIQKNINLLSLEGKRAPRLIGADLKGKPALVFFWAHWCSDCKSMIPVLQRVQADFPKLLIIGPTQKYGYAERGREVGAAEEEAYIRKVHGSVYAAVTGMSAPINEENFKVYGASTTPTVVLVDSKGVVQLYHPGTMTYEELAPRLKALP